MFDCEVCFRRYLIKIENNKKLLTCRHVDKYSLVLNLSKLETDKWSKGNIIPFPCASASNNIFKFAYNSIQKKALSLVLFSILNSFPPQF